MSKISVNSNVVLKSVKIYAENGILYADLVGEAMSNIGPANYNFSRIQLDFNMPEQTNAGAFCFRDGMGRVGYNFDFGSVLYLNQEDEQAPVTEDNSQSFDEKSEEANDEQDK